MQQKQDSNGADAQEAESFSDVPIITPKASWVLPFVAIILQLIVASLLAVFAFVGVWVQHDAETIVQSPISTWVHNLYITGITIMATLISAFTAGQIRTLWLRDIMQHSEPGLMTLRDRRMATGLVGQAGIVDQAKTWPITVTFLISGLITTAIVAGLSFTSDNYMQSYYTDLTTDFSFNGEGAKCLILDGNASSSSFVWKLDNGSTLAVNGSEGINCEPQKAKAILSDPMRLSSAVILEYVYTIGGVPIDRGAIGVPVDYNYGFVQSFGYGLWQTSLTHLQWSRNCLPVLSQNPVQCQAAGNVTVSQNLLTVEAAGCTISNPIYAVDPNNQGASAAGACTDNHQVGTATIVIGSVNDHAATLAKLMNGPDWKESVQNYSVTCTVDIAPSLAFRQLTYGFIDINDYALLEGVSSDYHVTGEGAPTCFPYGSNFTFLTGSTEPGNIDIARLLTDSALATSAGAFWPMLNENRYSDGWLETLFTVSSAQSNLWAFNNSRNGIEDTIGLVSGIALGLFWGNTYGPNIRLEDGTIEFIGTRVEEEVVPLVSAGSNRGLAPRILLLVGFYLQLLTGVLSFHFCHRTPTALHKSGSTNFSLLHPYNY